MRFAAVTDLHFGRAVPHRGVDRKLTVRAPALTAAFVADINRRVRPDFVVVLGDVIEDEAPQADLDNYTEAVAILSGLNMPVRYVYGNHDLVNLTHDQLLTISGEIALNSSFDVKGWHLVRLHSTASFERPDRSGREPGLRAEIAPEHLNWLDQDLAAANRPTIIFGPSRKCGIEGCWHRRAHYVTGMPRASKLRGLVNPWALRRSTWSRLLVPSMRPLEGRPA